MNKKIIIPITCALIVIALLVSLFFANGFHIDLVPSGEQNITLEYGQKYQESGATAYLRGKLFMKNGVSVPVVSEGTVDDTKLGSYTVTYSAKKLFWDMSAVRTVTVVDTVAPTLTLEGKTEISVTKGNKYEEPGFSATDNYDGDIKDKVVITGEVDTNKVGEYEIKYEVADSSGNKAEAVRKVTVKAPVVVTKQPTVMPGARTVYLTFDDGPCAYTAKLLDVLKKYNVKATFFVTNNNPSYNYLFKRMVDEGHAIAIHTATHNYEKIYASEDAFFEDLYKMQNIIKEQTGVTTMLTRFPGGSSNTVSAFNKGIMTRLSQALTEKGFRYFDWNVTSGDAGETTSTSQVYKNVVNGMASHSVSVVLQHDNKGYSVNAVEDIIKWGLANGYTFKACDMTSPTFHHGINN